MMRILTKYAAFDGVEFYSEAECKAYEKKLAHHRLVGLTIEQIEAALSGSDSDLADAIEQIGVRIGNARRERGELRRQRKAKDAPPDPPASADSTERPSRESGDGFSVSNVTAQPHEAA
jgi:hypothetical protein